MDISESQIIAEFANVFIRPDSRVLVGIGDDAAVVTTGHRTVITTDMAVEGVHFKREWSSAFDIGRKITAANLADIYAMGALPDHLVVSVALTGNESLEWIKSLAIGIDQEARKCDATVVGGDVVRGNVVTISIAALGHVGTPVLRSGAQVGDEIFLSSLPGWSTAGFHILTNTIDPTSLANAAHAHKALAQFRAPTLDYAVSREFRFAHALCDVSDGLLTQAPQIANASGVKLLFQRSLIEATTDFAELAELAAELEADPWDWVGAGGEDHVMLGTGKKLPGIRVGQVISGEGVEIAGLERKPRGFTHFR